MCGEDKLRDILQTPRGSVSPLSITNDADNIVSVLFTSQVDSADSILIHPYTNTATILVSPESIKAVLEKHGSIVKTVDLSVVAETRTALSTSKSKTKPNSTDKVPSETTAGIDASKDTDFSKWYTQVVTRTDMIDYYDISGCYILRPWSYFIWEQIQNYFDALIKKSGVKNAYFPLFVSEKSLIREKDHIEGFAPEVAWVTRAGSSELEEPIAIRPTSETIMYASFSNWIRSHRDLPLRLNQWSNVVRWEFKNPTPFVRSREFLWQEGHSAFKSKAEAEAEVFEILEYYARVYEDLLAVPVTKGMKSEMEKFAGALYTTTIEIFVPKAERGIQAATSHCLGQNFAEMFSIQFEDENRQKQKVWQNSWGLSTRSIGAMVMVHGDDKGLVLPPKVAPIQVVFVPIYNKKKPEYAQKAVDAVNALADQLESIGIRVERDVRLEYTSGWKYNQWELKGVPLRIEIGPRDIDDQCVMVVRRVDGVKLKISMDEFVPQIVSQLETVHKIMFESAKSSAEKLVFTATKWTQFIEALNKGGRALCLWCDTVECETAVRARSAVESKATARGLSGKAKTLCTPLDQPELPDDALCFACGSKAKGWTWFGRSY